MTLHDLEKIAGALADHEARYLVVGGVAVNAHGYARATRDLDLVIRLTEENTRRTLRALGALEYRPIVPVPLQDFADRDKRREWKEERNMEVFSLVSDRHPNTPVDVFVEEPFDFDHEFQRSVVGELAPGVRLRFAGLETLISMKEAAGRPRDQDDADQLRHILRELGDTDRE